MNDTLIRYLVRYVGPRLIDNFKDLQFFLALLAGFTFGYFPGIAVRALSYELVYQYASYNLMAFGFTIAALAISFAASTSSFQAKLFEVSDRSGKKDRGAWEDALFVISWTGFVHFVSLLASLATMALSYRYDSDARYALVFDLQLSHVRIAYSIFFFIQSYAMLQFLYTLLSIFMFCHAYVRDRRAEWATRTEKEAAADAEFHDD